MKKERKETMKREEKEPTRVKLEGEQKRDVVSHTLIGSSTKMCSSPKILVHILILYNFWSKINIDDLVQIVYFYTKLLYADLSLVAGTHGEAICNYVLLVRGPIKKKKEKTMKREEKEPTRVKLEGEQKRDAVSHTLIGSGTKMCSSPKILVHIPTLYTFGSK
jgi:hypothetical protein